MFFKEFHSKIHLEFQNIITRICKQKMQKRRQFQEQLLSGKRIFMIDDTLSPARTGKFPTPKMGLWPFSLTELLIYFNLLITIQMLLIKIQVLVKETFRHLS